MSGVRRVVLAFVCSVASLAFAQTAEQCVTFESPTSGTQILVGSGVLQAEIADIWGSSFTLGNGTSTAGRATITSGGFAGGTGNEVSVNNINLSFGGPLGRVLESIHFAFGWHGGNLNLSVNGVAMNFGSFSQLNGTTIAGVTIQVAHNQTLGVEQGRVTLTGAIHDDRFSGHLTVGGQELFIDDLCWR